MKIKEIVRAICILERGEAEINIAQMTEAIGNLGEMLYLDSGGQVLLALLANGKKRHNRMAYSKKPRRK